MGHNRTYSIATWLARAFFAVMILLFAFWAIGEENFKHWWYYLRGRHESYETVEKFYKAATQRDTATLIKLFSRRLLEKEGRDKIMTTLNLGMANTPDFNINLTNTQIKTDTIELTVNVSRSYSKYSPIKTTQIYLIHEDGEWKITLPE